MYRDPRSLAGINSGVSILSREAPKTIQLTPNPFDFKNCYYKKRGQILLSVILCAIWFGDSF